MNSTAVHSKHSTPNMVLLGSLYLAELCVLAIVISLFRLTSKPDMLSFLSSPPGALFLVAASGFALSSGIIIHQFLKSLHTRSRQFLLTLTMNLVVMLMIVGTGELAVRLLSVKTPTGIKLGGILLRPREWHDMVAHHSQALKKAATQETYLAFDKQLGWTVGPNRRSEDGLYLSSAEGLRSPRTGIIFADQPASCRIALLGDSFTFAEEVAFEESWGYQLELGLGQKCQVLNFGVLGYGVDQAYLRYMRDVRPWHPDIVIFAFIGDDVTRTMSVYGFLLFPYGTIPFAKPRFILTDEQLSIVNAPLPKAEDILSKWSIRELPFIEYDKAYNETEWDRQYWRSFNYSYLFRLLTSWHPLWESPGEQVSNRAMKSLNREIFRSFLRATSSAGSTPILVYLPAIEELPPSSNDVPIGLEILRDAGLPHVDLRPCLSHTPTSDYFMPGQHYSLKGNLEIARCVREVVIAQLSQRKGLSGLRPVLLLDQATP